MLSGEVTQNSLCDFGQAAQVKYQECAKLSRKSAGVITAVQPGIVVGSQGNKTVIPLSCSSDWNFRWL